MTDPKCYGCSWGTYSHQHSDAEDGARATCCAHTCGTFIDLLSPSEAQARWLLPVGVQVTRVTMVGTMAGWNVYRFWTQDGAL
jgi:hypothetical protein